MTARAVMTVAELAAVADREVRQELVRGHLVREPPAGYVRDYLEAGTRMVWVVSPATRSVVVWRPPAEARRFEAADLLSGDDVLPGFAVGVAELLEV